MTPQPGPPPAAPKSWFARNWGWVVGGGCLVLACCGIASVLALGGAVASEVVTPSAARVDCGTPGPSGVDCEVKRTEGLSGFRACWDLEITCDNGGVMTGHGCGSVGAGEDGKTVNLPVAAFSNQDACDAPKQGVVKNLSVTNE